MRLSRPADFWRLLKPPKPPAGIPPATLFQHYQDLLQNSVPVGTPEESLPLVDTSDSPFTAVEVREAVRKLKHNKALGTSWISPELLQHHRDTRFYDALALLLNQARTKGVPASWNTLHVTSIFKKGDPADANNYRGISVMSCLPKLFAMVQLARLEQSAEEGGLRATT